MAAGPKCAQPCGSRAVRLVQDPPHAHVIVELIVRLSIDDIAVDLSLDDSGAFRE